MNMGEYCLRKAHLIAIHEHNLKVLEVDWLMKQEQSSFANAEYEELRVKRFELDKQSKLIDVMKAKLDIEKIEMELNKIASKNNLTQNR